MGTCQFWKKTNLFDVKLFGFFALGGYGLSVVSKFVHFAKKIVWKT